MKRTISLVLCLTILLGLLTGLAGATETGQLFCVSNLKDQTWLFGTMGLSFKMDGDTYTLPKTARVYFDNEKLGSVFYGDNNMFIAALKELCMDSNI